jgi:hypothetical protein
MAGGGVPRWLYWTPRILGVALALFLSVFALDAVNEGVLAVLMHLLPAALVLLVLALSWRHDLIGALGFLALGVLYILWTGARMRWTVYAAIAGPLFVMSGLFLAAWLWKRRGPAVTTAAPPA